MGGYDEMNKYPSDPRPGCCSIDYLAIHLYVTIPLALAYLRISSANLSPLLVHLEHRHNSSYTPKCAQKRAYFRSPRAVHGEPLSCLMRKAHEPGRGIKTK